MTHVVWREIETPAPESFQGFCGARWDWTLGPAFAGSDLGSNYWLVRSGERILGGLQRAAPGSAPPDAGARLCAEVDDLEETLRQATALGGLAERERTALGGLAERERTALGGLAERWFAIIRDPSGVSFGLWTPNEPGPRGKPDSCR